MSRSVDIYLSFHLSQSVSIYLSIYLSIKRSLFMHKYIHMYVCMYVCMYVRAAEAFSSTAINLVVFDPYSLSTYATKRGKLWYILRVWRDYWLSCFSLSLDNHHEDLESGIRFVQRLATIIPWFTNFSSTKLYLEKMPM